MSAAVNRLRKFRAFVRRRFTIARCRSKTVAKIPPQIAASSGCLNRRTALSYAPQAPCTAYPQTIPVFLAPQCPIRHHPAIKIVCRDAELFADLHEPDFVGCDQAADEIDGRFQPLCGFAQVEDRQIVHVSSPHGKAQNFELFRSDSLPQAVHDGQLLGGHQRPLSPNTIGAVAGMKKRESSFFFLYLHARHVPMPAKPSEDARQGVFLLAGMDQTAWRHPRIYGRIHQCFVAFWRLLPASLGAPVRPFATKTRMRRPVCEFPRRESERRFSRLR